MGNIFTLTLRLLSVSAYTQCWARHSGLKVSVSSGQPPPGPEMRPYCVSGDCQGVTGTSCVVCGVCCMTTSVFIIRHAINIWRAMNLFSQSCYACDPITQKNVSSCNFSWLWRTMARPSDQWPAARTWDVNTGDLCQFKKCWARITQLYRDTRNRKCGSRGVCEWLPALNISDELTSSVRRRRRKLSETLKHPFHYIDSEAVIGQNA